MQFDVTIQRVEYRQHTFRVNADNASEAEFRANSLAAYHDFAQEILESDGFNTTMVCALGSEENGVINLHLDMVGGDDEDFGEDF